MEFSYIEGWGGVTQNDGWGRALCSPAIFPEPLFQKKFKSRVSAIFFFKKGEGANVLIINIIEAVGDS